MAHSCEEVLREVERFLDRELPISDWQVIQTHIDECTSCDNRVEFTRKLRIIVASKCRREQVPDTLRAKIHSVLSEETPDRP